METECRQYTSLLHLIQSPQGDKQIQGELKRPTLGSTGMKYLLQEITDYLQLLLQSSALKLSYTFVRLGTKLLHSCGGVYHEWLNT